MAEITASLVKDLREMTGLGMMECKKALSEANGDLKKAEELLRIKSGAKASKAASRVAAEGIIGAFVSADRKLGALVEINCETDFVAKNEDFLAFAHGIAELVALEAPSDLAALSILGLGDTSVEGRRQILVQKIGENISVRRFVRIAAAGKLTHYVHGLRIGVLVDVAGEDAVAKDIAMHIAFSKPRFMRREDVPAEIVNVERDILVARAKESGKPADIVSKMVDGGVNKFLSEVSLLGQPFVKDDKTTVEKLLASHNSRLNQYSFYVVGEGIDKKTTDFAAEVMATAGFTR